MHQKVGDTIKEENEMNEKNKLHFPGVKFDFRLFDPEDSAWFRQLQMMI